jgi:uncharacterized protein YdiU (UPF0061 family)
MPGEEPAHGIPVADSDRPYPWSVSVATPPTVTLDDRFGRELAEMALPWQAEQAPDPRLLVLNEPLAGELGFDAAWLRSPDGLRLLVGTLVPDGARPVAQAYAGHQFGGFVPRLGDGRALLLGEVVDADGRLRDLHRKGSGRTPFARGGDGLAAVGPMLREYIVSEAMHALGVPTTRSLAVVGTGRQVRRETMLPGAVLARVASSHLRVGSFQYVRAAEDIDLLRRLADHAMARHHPDAAEADNPYLALFDAVVAAQAALIGAFRQQYSAAWLAGMSAKLGMPEGLDDAVTSALTNELLTLLQNNPVDYTSFFRSLGAAARGDAEPARGMFLDLVAFDEWAERWFALGPDADVMQRVNPVYIPRNHLVEEALAAATGGDLQPLDGLLEAVARPFDERPGLERYAAAAPEDFGAYRTFCGT